MLSSIAVIDGAAEGLWMKSVLESLAEENSQSLLLKRDEFGWTTSGPWVCAMTQEQQSAWQKQMSKVGRASSKSTTNSSKNSKKSSKESVGKFDADKLPPTPPSDDTDSDAEEWDPNADHSNDDDDEDASDDANDEKDDKVELPQLAQQEAATTAVDTDDKKKITFAATTTVTRPKARGYGQQFADKTRWRRTVESFDDAIDNDKIWQSYLKHFTTADLNWLSDQFLKSGGRRGYIETEDAIMAAKNYMCLRWNSACANLLVIEDIDRINTKIGVNSGDYDFDSLVKFVYNFQQAALGKDENHGFKSNQVHFLKNFFYSHVQTGVKPRNLFSFLADLGHDVTGKGEEAMMALYTRFRIHEHVNEAGYIPFSSFLYFLQRVNQSEDDEYRAIEAKRVIDSQFNDREVEEFRSLFDRFVDTPTGEMSLAAIKEMFKHLMMPLKIEQTKEVAQIIEESDENSNGNIDFGEFLMLLRELWNRNFADMKSLTAAIDANHARGGRRLSASQLKTETNGGVIGRRGSMRRRSTLDLLMAEHGV